MRSDPWKRLPRPTGKEYFKTVLVDTHLNPRELPISWALDFEGRRAIYFEYPAPKRAAKDAKVPSFKSLETRDIDCGPGRRAFSVTLRSPEIADVFFEMCRDMVDALQDVPVEHTRNTIVSRLVMWSNLLKGGRSGLTLGQQRGLLAELVFLRRHAIPVSGDRDAVAAWEGPYGGRQDFRFGQTFVEVKSTHGGGGDKIKISSEKQLASNDTERLHLYVLEVNESNGEGGMRLGDAVTALQKMLPSPLARSGFLHKLQAVGYDHKTEYPMRWTLGKELDFLVRDGFPRIMDVEFGISDVTYSLDLSSCKEYEEDIAKLREDIRCTDG